MTDEIVRKLSSLISFRDNVDVSTVGVSAMINRGTRMQISRRAKSVFVVARLILLAPVDSTAAKLNSTARTAGHVQLRPSRSTRNYFSAFYERTRARRGAPVPQPLRASVPHEHLHNIQNAESILTIPARIILQPLRPIPHPPPLQIISFLDPRFCSALFVHIARVRSDEDSEQR